MIRAWINQIQFADGHSIDLKESSILVLVGPNNSGKSLSIYSIKAHILPSASPPTSPISRISLKIGSSAPEILEYLKGPNSNKDTLRFDGLNVDEQTVIKFLDTPCGHHLSTLTHLEVNTANRLMDCRPPDWIERRQRFSAEHPFQLMFVDPSLELQASKVVRDAFGQDLVIHHGNGRTIPAYIGQRPELRQSEGRFDASYLDRIEALEELEHQGDGMRSFVSIVSRLVADRHPILMIDEPEAFLHPPQAKLLGDAIVKKKGSKQIVLATHHSGLLQGLLSADSSEITVVRLSRKGSTSSASPLSNSQIRELWSNPILRYGNVLDGIFHEGVILAESDGDCRFYEALSEVVVQAESLPDIHFTHSGGKSRLHVIVRALKGLSIPVATITDFDIMRVEDDLRKLVEAHGALWSDFRERYLDVATDVAKYASFKRGPVFLAEMRAVLKTIGRDDVVSRDAIRDIKALAKNASPWDACKHHGLNAISNGHARTEAEELLEGLANVGIFLVPVGEMEGFLPSSTSHGPAWVERALQRSLVDDEQLRGAREFVSRVVKFINQ